MSQEALNRTWYHYTHWHRIMRAFEKSGAIAPKWYPQDLNALDKHWTGMRLQHHYIHDAESVWWCLLKILCAKVPL